MGIFSKKTLTCERCGKEYEARMAVGEAVCSECLRIEQDKKDNVKGYVDYARTMRLGSYTEEQLEEIVARRDQILEKYRMTEGISRAELQQASDNYKKLSDDEAADVLRRMTKSSLTTTIGAVCSRHFFVPTAFEKVIVDAADVFAVGYTNDYKLQYKNHEVILCAVFTNDPCIPVFSMLYSGDLGFFELLKSKKGREGVAARFEVMCPNLTYPVQDLKHLKQQIKSEGTIKGAVEKEFMLDKIADASVSSGIFNTKKMHSDFLPASAELLDAYGYIQDLEIDQILKMDKKLNQWFWKKQIERMANK